MIGVRLTTKQPCPWYGIYEEYAEWLSTKSASLGSVSKILTALPSIIFAEIPDNVPWID